MLITQFMTHEDFSFSGCFGKNCRCSATESMAAFSQIRKSRKVPERWLTLTADTTYGIRYRSQHIHVNQVS